MITKKTKSNFFLFTVILIAIIFYLYNFSQNKGSIKIEQDRSVEIKKNNVVEKNVTKFTNVEYKLLMRVAKIILQKEKRLI